jgi:hypothetical protein
MILPVVVETTADIRMKDGWGFPQVWKTLWKNCSYTPA